MNERKPINRFVLGSIILHILSGVVIAIGSQFPPPKQEEIVEVDFTTAATAPEASAPVVAPEIQEAAPAVQAPPQPEPVAEKSEPVPAPVEPVAKREVKPVIAKAELPKPQPKPVEFESKSVPVAAAIVEKSIAPAQAAEPEPTLDDIETPTLDDSEVVTALKEEQSQTKVSKAEIEEKLKKAEQAQEEKAAIMAKQMEQETNSTEQSINDQISETESAMAEESAALAAQAQARADALKAQKEAAAAEKPSKENGNGLAAQNAGPGQQGELRALDQLRQMPGNPKPQYEAQERLNKQQGNVIFKAFVTPNGELTQFQMLQSTGHRNLDAKTLRALKQWKFYPGQQGWVELPFKWDLKGGPQEMPTLLRRRVSEKN